MTFLFLLTSKFKSFATVQAKHLEQFKKKDTIDRIIAIEYKFQVEKNSNKISCAKQQTQSQCHQLIYLIFNRINFIGILLG